MALDHVVGRAVLHARDEEHAGLGQPGKPREVDVAAIEDEDGARDKRLPAGDGHFMSFAFCDHQRGGQVAIVVEGEVQLHRALGSPEHGPFEHLRAQIDHRGVQGQQLVLKTKFVRAGDLAAPRQQLIKHLLVELPRPMGIRIRQGRPRGRRESQMRQLALAACEAAADLAQRVRSPQLTEHHRDELAPTREPACVPLRLSRHDGLLKLRARKELE